MKCRPINWPAGRLGAESAWWEFQLSGLETTGEQAGRMRWRVPREDHTLLVRPELKLSLERARSNASALDTVTVTIQGQPLSRLREQCRREVLFAARQFTEELTGSAVSVDTSPLLIATGHQPELFHPGVWIKHLTVSRLSRRAGATGLNLIVDNDTLHASRIAVPAGSQERPVREWIDFDAPQPVRPWEEALIVDLDCFASFGARVTDHLQRAWGLSPLIESGWSFAVEHARKRPHLAECLSAMRARLERTFGPGNLELPMSRVCELDSFRHFAGHLLQRAEAFAESYNAAVRDYRRRNRIRSTTHPVPELQRSGEWQEAPFWIWPAGAVNRSRLFVCRRDSFVELASQPDGEVLAAIPAATDPEKVADGLAALSQRGYRLRTRALTTTMFVRLCLCDLFVHGIGGAQYDAMTDVLLERFFGGPVPGFLALSATEWLPFAAPFAEDEDDARRLRHRLRDIEQNPQRHLSGNAPEAAQRLVQEKLRLIVQGDPESASQTETASARPGLQRYRRSPELNRALAPFTREIRQKALEELRQVEAHVSANRVLRNREWSFCLYPAGQIHRMLAAVQSQIEAD